MASWFRSCGTLGVVLSMVDGTVMIAALLSVAIAAALNEKKRHTQVAMNVNIPPKNPIFLIFTT
ncbi:hypothetical protein [uncultured Duncaniella sp.]|uniref:hypothetical protein n=1 Tax=uncultured Duncaniella sp. TaxID=2768039 RepID=UPI0026EF175A|nr:hypothetical protein [uncultured Duncaniella sp.]